MTGGLAADVGLLAAMQDVVKRLEGAYALAVVDTANPDQVVAARRGSPLVVGVGIGENFLASDQLALRQVTDRFIYLEEGDLVSITPSSLQIFDEADQQVERELTEGAIDAAAFRCQVSAGGLSIRPPALPRAGSPPPRTVPPRARSTRTHQP